jgi:hypothetical protein
MGIRSRKMIVATVLVTGLLFAARKLERWTRPPMETEVS